jgi:hypothetical protein
MDVGQINHVLNYSLDLKKKERILNKLDIAEAFNYAYLGSQPKQKNKENKAFHAYKRWRGKLYRAIFPQQKRVLVWDLLPKNRKGKHKIT